MPLRNLVWLLAVPAVVLLALTISYSAPAPDKDYKLVRQIVDVLAEVDTNFVRELSDAERHELIENMINGGLQKLDPYSEYLNADKVKQFETNSEGHFGGVGISLGIDDATKLMKVDHPMPGTPAYNAGVLAGDLIVKIDGHATTPVSENYTERKAVADARERITGKVGSQVVVTLRRAGRTPAEFDVSLTRGQIEMHPVSGVSRSTTDPNKWNWFLDDKHKIALIRLSTFSELSEKEVRAAVGEIEAAGGRGIILDLRDNPGGLLNQAIGVANLFLTEGKIVGTKNRQGTERPFSAKADKAVFLPKPGEPRPMVVLLNRESASASEIVAAALQDHGRAVVVGERSYGKGSVQKLLPLPGDPPAKVKLTTETYWRPSGKNIHRHTNAKETDDWGVRPDPNLEVPTTEEERIRHAIDVTRVQWTAGKPGSFDAANPPKQAPPVIPKSDGRPLLDMTKPYTDKPQAKAVEVLVKKLGG